MLKMCPFCGYPAQFVEGYFPGHFGPQTPNIKIKCLNEKCWCEMDAVPTDYWESGRGTFSVKEKVMGILEDEWNKRAFPIMTTLDMGER